MSGDGLADTGSENVLVTPGDVTTISGAAAASTSRDAVTTGGDAIAVNLSPDGKVLNVAFITGLGEAQIIQLKVADLRDGRGPAQRGDEGSDGDGIVIAGDLTTVSAAAIAADEGAATSVTGISVSAELGDGGDLTLTFIDENGDLQLIETNVARLLPG